MGRHVVPTNAYFYREETVRQWIEDIEDNFFETEIEKIFGDIEHHVRKVQMNLRTVRRKVERAPSSISKAYRDCAEQLTQK